MVTSSKDCSPKSVTDVQPDKLKYSNPGEKTSSSVKLELLL
jgi:hypothetical protein